MILGRPTLPNKRQRQTPRKSSTNNRALSTRSTTQPQSRSMVATGQNPSIVIGKAPSNPPPVSKYSDKWVKRVYSSSPLSVPTSAVVDVKISQLFPGLTSGSTVFFDKIQVWNTNRLNNCRVGLLPEPITDLGLVDTIEVDDYGTSSALSGTTFVIPLGHAKQVTSSSTVSILSLNGATGNETFTGTYVVHSHVWVQI